MKECTQCGVMKAIADFYLYNGKPIAACKVCTKERRKKYYEENREKVNAGQRAYRKANIEAVNHRNREYHRKNRDKLLGPMRERSCRHYEQNREHIREYGKEYRSKNRDHLLAKKKEYYNNNKDKYAVWRLKAVRKHLSTVEGKLANRIRARINELIKDGSTGSFRHFDYDVDMLARHLKKTMPKGYAWQDFLNGALHIDHKIPVSAFNFKTPEDIDFKRCWALKNLQLLPARENMIKSSKLEKPFQPSLAFGGSL